MRLMCVGGTWSYGRHSPIERRWWWPGSPWLTFMANHNVLSIGPDRPYSWSTGIGGMCSLRRGGAHADWQASGESLYAYLVPVVNGHTHPNPPYPYAMVAHSHGGEVALYAAAAGLKIPCLVTVGTPVRADMEPVINAAKPNIGYWMHVYSIARWPWQRGFDWMQRAGELLDGHVGWQQKIKQANLNVGLKGVGHSGLLYKPVEFQRWVHDGLLDTMYVALEVW